jgi:glycosyltransferase
MTPPDSAAAPSVTVITVVRNGARTIERAIESAASQTHRPVQHLVVDGASTDGTLEIVRRWGDRVRWISEPDRGLYDAMNKGVSLVEDPQSYVHFLNADDVFRSPAALAEMIAGSDGEDFLYGRVDLRDEQLGDSNFLGREATRKDMLYGMRIRHQASLCRRSVFDRIGGFDLRYRLAADYDWMLRVLDRGDVTRRFVPVILVTMSAGGLSYARFPASARERWRIVRERYRALDLARFTAYTIFGDYLRHYAQRGLRRVGLLNAARGLKRRVWPAA